MKCVTFDTVMQPHSTGVDYWREATRRFFGPLDTTSLSEGELEAQMQVYRVGPLRLYTIHAGAHRTARATSTWPATTSSTTTSTCSPSASS